MDRLVRMLTMRMFYVLCILTNTLKVPQNFFIPGEATEIPHSNTSLNLSFYIFSLDIVSGALY